MQPAPYPLLMPTGHRADPNGSVRRSLLAQVGLVYVAYCLLSLASRAVPALLAVVVAVGMVLPPVWNRLTGTGTVRARPRRAAAVGWGLAGGTAFGGYTVLVLGSPSGPPEPVVAQLVVGLVVWLALWSPFQELLFRGWMQPRLQVVWGRSPGILATSLAFAVWHFFPPLEGTATATLPVTSLAGVASALGLGVVMGYVYDRTGSLLAPWLGHAVAGLGLILAGRMAILVYTP